MQTNNSSYTEKDKGLVQKNRKLSSTPKQALPYLFTLELTTLCNNHCSGCANIEVPQQRQLKQQQHNVYIQNWRTIIDKIILQTKGKAIIRLSGGEPTLHPEFLDIVQYIDTLNVPHALLTTGKWQKVGREKLIETYKKCRNAQGFLISLHGADSYTHNTFVQSSEKGFEETISNIRFATQNGICVFTNTVITNQNYNQIGQILQFSKSLGTEYSIFNRFLAQSHPLLPTATQLLSAIKSIAISKKEGYQCRIGNNIPACFYPLTNFPAVAGYELCHISPTGNIRPDNLTPYSFGNILNQDIRTIWESVKAQNYRQTIPTDCQQCAAFNSCRGGAKSLYFLTPECKDSLMTGALTMEQTQAIIDDKEKKSLKMMALTSD